MKSNENQLLELKAQYRILGEVEELFPRQSFSKYIVGIRKKRNQILFKISKIENQMEKENQLVLNEGRFGCDGVRHIFQEPMSKGIAKISLFNFRESENLLYNLRVVRDAGQIFRMYDGDYVRLSVGNELVMSDTPMERISNTTFVQKANGRVLIAGLGLGMIINNIVDKDDVTEVIVIEKHQDVIDLIEPKIAHSKLKVICSDIFDWKPQKGEKFDTIYFDIWAEITEENLTEIKLLHNRYKGNLNRVNPRSWMNSWMKEYLQKRKKREQRSYYI